MCQPFLNYYEANLYGNSQTRETMSDPSDQLWKVHRLIRIQNARSLKMWQTLLQLDPHQLLAKFIPCQQSLGDIQEVRVYNYIEALTILENYRIKSAII